MTDLGQLDITGQLFTRTPVIGASGAVTYALRSEGILFLSNETPRAATILAGARDAERTETVFKCRWFDGLVTGMQLTAEGKTYRIVRVDELGRRDGYRIYGREVA